MPVLERPLSPRSVIASLLLGMQPPRLAGARLVRWCGLFGIAPGTARVALSRMVERGELRNDGGVYELVGAVRARQPAQDFALAPRVRRWDGTWDLAVVRAGDARPPADRQALRAATRALRLAPLREGVWARPANLPPEAAPAGWRAVVDEQCSTWQGRPEDDAAALAERLFAPATWADRARALVERLDRMSRALAAGDDGVLADAFATGAAALAHLRADPLLPPALVREDWPGDDLRRAYLGYQRHFGGCVRDWFRRT